MPGLAPRRNDLVRLRNETGERSYRVLQVRNPELSIARVDAAGRAIGEPLQAHIAEVNVVKEFGEPIYAGLRSLARIDRASNKPSHVVIQGENYYALETLMYTHAEKVDVIYIDPPYNTGAAEWIYNDRYVDGQDSYRHSKWLAFMKRRLQHAKALLKDTGVILMAIDDNEQARLKLLADRVFGEQNFIANVVWQGNTNSYARYVSVGHDYMLVYAKSEQRLAETGVRWREPKIGVAEAIEAAATIWEDSAGNATEATRAFRIWLKTLPPELRVAGIDRYNSIEAESGRVFSGDGNMVAPEARPNRSRRPLIHPVTGKPCPVPPNGWRYSDEEMDRRLKAGLVVFGKDEKKIPRGKSYLDEMDVRVVDAVFTQNRTRASRHLERVLGSKNFPFPKDVEVLARWVQIVSADNPNAIVLDFFAGTGTTAEAVMQLNARDGGRRQSIVITNNEIGASTAKRLRKEGFYPGDPEWEAEGVFRKVTWPRIETIVTGRRRDDSVYSVGLDENVEFFELTYEDPDHIGVGLGFDAVAALLWLKAGATGKAIETTSPEGWAINSDGSYGVLFDVKHASAFARAARAVAATLRHAFIITNQESAYQQVVAALPPQSRAFSSTRLYSDYLRTFEINGKD